MLKYFLELSNPPGKVPSHSCSTTTRCWSRYICRTICRATSSQISRSFCLGFSQKNRKRCGRAFVLKHSLELSDPPGKVPSHSCSTTTRCWGIYICRTICRATFSLILRPFCLYCLQTDLTRNYLSKTCLGTMAKIVLHRCNPLSRGSAERIWGEFFFLAWQFLGKLLTNFSANFDGEFFP